MINIIFILITQAVHANASVNVQIETENPKLYSELIKLTSTYSTQTYSDGMDQEISDKIKTYLQDNEYFSSSVVLDKTVLNNLKFTIKNPYRLKAYFNIENEDSDIVGVGRIREALDWTNYNEQLSDPATYTKEKVIKLYREYGYSNVQATYKIKISDFNTNLVFNIKPGVFSRLGRLTVISNNPDNAKTFAAFIEQHNSSLQKSFGGYYRGNINEGVEALLLDLVYKGYLYAELRSISEEFAKSQEVVNVQIVIDEGFATYVEKINIVGNQKFEKKVLEELLDIKPQDKLNISKLEQSLADVKQYYTDRSFLNMEFNNIDQVVQYNRSQRLATITIDINEGYEVSVNDIIIEGNSKTKNHVILNEINFKKGGSLSPKKIDQNRQILLRTGLFTRADITTVETNEPGKVDVRIEVTEKDPGVFNLGVGISDEYNLTLRGFSNIYYDNIFGTARRVSGHFELQKALTQDEAGVLEHEIGLGYREPYIFDWKVGSRVGVTKEKNIISVNRQESDGIVVEDKIAFNTGLELKFHERSSFSYGLWNFENSTLFRYVNDTEESESTITGSTGPSIELDFRDHPFDPTRGWYYQSSFEYSSPFLGLNLNNADYKYYRLTGSFNYYVPVGKVVFAQVLSGGYLANVSDSSLVIPESKGFFLGGRSTIRGFELNSIPDRSEFPSDSLGVLPIHDTSIFYLIKTELRFPISGLFGGVFFYDGGSVLIDGIDFEKSYRDSVGLGLRFSTPVGPVSLEYGWRLSWADGLSTDGSRVHFSIGMF